MSADLNTTPLEGRLLRNYWVDGQWFTTYKEAATYANKLLDEGVYRCVFTKSEIEAHRGLKID